MVKAQSMIEAQERIRKLEAEANGEGVECFDQHSAERTMLVVHTKSELEAAKASGALQIEVSGKLADSLHEGKAVAKAGAAAVAVIAAAVAAMPFTGGGSALAVAPVAAMSGVGVAAIIAAASVGIALILAVFKHYEEISYEKGKLVLRKSKQ